MKSLMLIIMSFLMICGGLYAQKLPENMVLQEITGKRVSLKDVVKDELVIVTFWSTTCKPCLSELAALMEIKDKWKGKVRILAISTDDARSLAKVKSLAKGNKWEFEVYVDINKKLYNACNLTLIPTAMIVNKEKEVVYLHTGYAPGDEIVLVDKALNLLKEK